MTDIQLKKFAETQAVLALVEILGSELNKEIIERADLLDEKQEKIREKVSKMENLETLEKGMISHGISFIEELLTRVEAGE